MRRLLKLIATETANEMRNQLEFLSDWGQYQAENQYGMRGQQLATLFA